MSRLLEGGDAARTGSWRSAKDRSSSSVTSSDRTRAFRGIARGLCFFCIELVKVGERTQTLPRFLLVSIKNCFSNLCVNLYRYYDEELARAHKAMLNTLFEPLLETHMTAGLTQVIECTQV